jgi:hypothetical protein
MKKVNMLDFIIGAAISVALIYWLVSMFLSTVVLHP